MSSSTMLSPLKAYKRVMECQYCGRKGHVKAFCWDLHGELGEHNSESARDLDDGKNTKQINIQSLFSMALEKGLVPVLMTQDEYELWKIVKGATTEANRISQAKLVAATTTEQSDGCISSGHAGKGLSGSPPWIIDSGATNHMTGLSKIFSSYAPRSGKDKVQIADGSAAPIMGTGTISCSSSLSLSPVLHVPNFPVNLLSVSSLTKALKCRAIFEPEFCIFQELKSGKILGMGTECKGLYFLDNSATSFALAATSTTSTDEVIMLHRRLGHLSFRTLGRMFPSLLASCYKEKLICDVCELAKHTRSNYPSSNERSETPFEVVHSDVWGPSKVTSLLGERWYVTFIDGFSRCTWLYLLKHKSQVLSAFKDFHTLVCNQYNACVKIFRSDNGTEYVNGDFKEYLSSRGIIHQTTCVDTAEQNGVAERKNRHLLEVARSLMFMTNVPKFLWGEAIKTAAYLINRMPSRILNYKTPIECLTGSNSFIVPPKVFGCTCFVHDYRNSVGKLDPRAVKCIFVGYSPTQKGYRCWCPTERRFFVSMDVTFHEREPFYSSNNTTTYENGSKGENVNKETILNSPMLIPMIDMLQMDNRMQGEERGRNDAENEVCDGSPLHHVFEPSISSPANLREQQGESVPHDTVHEDSNNMPTIESPSSLGEPTHGMTELEGNDDQETRRLKFRLAREFEVKDLGQLRYFLGIEVSRSAKGIYLSQRKYILDLLSETGMRGCRPAYTPIEQNHRLVKEGGSPVDREQYQKLVGRLIYLSHTRPDIAFAVSVVSRFMHNPRSHHLNAVMRIIRYLKGCPGRGLLYASHGNLQVECYTDADWAGSLDDRRSTSGYCTFVGGNLVTWRSKKQNVVARSTAEAELRAMAHGVCEVLWLKILLMELGLFRHKPLLLYCDNKAALDIVHNPVQHGRTKHIEIDRHFIKEKLDHGIICMPYVSSSDQMADILTKGLPEKGFSSLCSKMGLYDAFTPS